VQNAVLADSLELVSFLYSAVMKLNLVVVVVVVVDIMDKSFPRSQWICNTFTYKMPANPPSIFFFVFFLCERALQSSLHKNIIILVSSSSFSSYMKELCKFPSS